MRVPLPWRWRSKPTMERYLLCQMFSSSPLSGKASACRISGWTRTMRTSS